MVSLGLHWDKSSRTTIGAFHLQNSLSSLLALEAGFATLFFDIKYHSPMLSPQRKAIPPREVCVGPRNAKCIEDRYGDEDGFESRIRYRRKRGLVISLCLLVGACHSQTSPSPSPTRLTPVAEAASPTPSTPLTPMPTPTDDVQNPVSLRLIQGREHRLSSATVQLKDVIRHQGQDPVVRIDLGNAEGRIHQVEIREGDLAQAGMNVLELGQIEKDSSGGAVLQTTLSPIRTSSLKVPLGQAFKLSFGQLARLPTKQELQLTAIGHYGVEVLYQEDNGVTNYKWMDFGFYREGKLLIEVLEIDRASRSVGFRVESDSFVQQKRSAKYSQEVKIGIRDLIVFPDGATLSLRSALRRSYAQIGCRFLSNNGDAAGYPEADIGINGGQKSASEFRLLGRNYKLALLGFQTEPRLEARVRVTPIQGEKLSLGKKTKVSLGKQYEGPGMRLRYDGSGYGHGSRANGIPTTRAWASLTVFQGGKSHSFRVDLASFKAGQEYDILEWRVTVYSVQDHQVQLRVKRR